MSQTPTTTPPSEPSNEPSGRPLWFGGSLEDHTFGLSVGLFFRSPLAMPARIQPSPKATADRRRRSQGACGTWVTALRSGCAGLA